MRGTWFVSTFWLYWIMLLRMHICVQVLIWAYVFKLEWHIPKSRLAGSYGKSVTFWKIARPFSKVAAPYSIPPSSVWGFQFLHDLGSTDEPSYFSHFSVYEEVSHCGFDFHFSNNRWFWASFLYLLAVCVSSTDEYLFRSFAYF